MILFRENVYDNVQQDSQSNVSLENVSDSNVSGLGVRKCTFLYDGFQGCQVLLLWLSFGIFLIYSKKGMYKGYVLVERPTNSHLNLGVAVEWYFKVSYRSIKHCWWSKSAIDNRANSAVEIVHICLTRPLSSPLLSSSHHPLRSH